MDMAFNLVEDTWMVLDLPEKNAEIESTPKHPWNDQKISLSSRTFFNNCTSLWWSIIDLLQKKTMAYKFC